MSRTLNDLIAAAVLGGEEAEESIVQSAEVRTEAPEGTTDVPDDVEKIAAALEFMGRRGVGALLDKQAMEKLAKCGSCGKACPQGAKKCPHCGMAKKASAPENNMSQMHAEKVQRQVGPHAGAPPMKPPGFGQIPNNAGKKPGLPAPATGIDTSGQGHGTHHPALASNEAAIAYNKTEKSKKVLPALGQVLDTKAFADGKLKENLSNTSGDKNIKKAHDLSQIRSELERRGAGRTL